MKTVFSFCLGIAALGLWSARPAPADTIHLKLMASGASHIVNVYRPQRMNLTPTKLDNITKLPPDLVAPIYGTISMGAKEDRMQVDVILDLPENKEPRLFVDSNGNGDLTDDPAPEWRSRPYPGKPEMQMHVGTAVVLVRDGTELIPLHVGFTHVDTPDPARPMLRNLLLYYSDYAREGQIRFGDKIYSVMLTDDYALGDFRGRLGEKDSGVRLLVDLNANGKFESRGETFDVAQPFNIKGTTYEITDVSASGNAFALVKSTKSVPEIPPPPDLSVGKKAVPFEAKTTEGKRVKFPSDYAGRIVLLDFWATWCVPYVRELPNLLRVYRTYHAQGFDVLSVSLDQENAGEKLGNFTREHDIPWPQIYDGKFWQAAVAQRYAIEAIPVSFLIDGDTGEILAAGNSLRGDLLADTIRRALAHKRR